MYSQYVNNVSLTDDFKMSKKKKKYQPHAVTFLLDGPNFYEIHFKTKEIKRRIKKRKLKLRLK